MSETITLSGAQVISLEGAGTISDGYISIAGERIIAIGPSNEFRPSGEETILDVKGMSVLPGLIDSHCHLISENAYPITDSYVTRSTIAGVKAARMALECGLTSVRDVGCRHLGIYALKAAVEAGEIPGPRLQTSGRPIAGTGIMETWRSHSHDGPTEVLRGVRREWQTGANWLKLSISDGRWRDTSGWKDTLLLTPSEIRTAVEEAHRKDMRVVCHVDGPLGAALAVQERVDSIEHGVQIPDHLLDQMAEHQIFFVPTVWIYSTQDLKVFRADLSYLNELHSDTIRRALVAGVKIAAGVDYDYAKHPPLDGMVNELSTLVACGMSQLEAIEAATLHGAELLGWQSFIGSLAVGKLADLVVVDGDPLTDIEALSQVVLVVQNGQIVANTLRARHVLVPQPLPDLLPSWMA